MHDRRADLDLLRVLDAIHAEGGVTRAAERLNLSQSAISHSLARLRRLFGDPLFTRDGRQLSATPLTRDLIGPLRQGLQALDLLVANAGRFDPATAEAQYTISLRDPTETLMMPAIMRRIARAAPRVNLRTVQVRRRNLEAALATGAVSLATDIALPLSENVRRQKLSADRMVVVARRSHPLLRKGLTLDAYLALDHVMVTSRRKGPGLEDVELSKRGLRRRVRLRCRNYLAALGAVAETDLVLTMAERYAARFAPGLRLQVMPFPLKMPTLDLYLYWHASADGDAASRWLRGLVVDSFKDTR
ncbi:MAG: LysR family transcriptional regulator [Alphaproteobacteria bacterium]|nr:LysR family transcriptional regulator [Alphaproteobacteria bacterium]